MKMSHFVPTGRAIKYPPKCALPGQIWPKIGVPGDPEKGVKKPPKMTPRGTPKYPPWDPRNTPLGTPQIRPKSGGFRAQFPGFRGIPALEMGTLGSNSGVNSAPFYGPPMVQHPMAYSPMHHGGISTLPVGGPMTTHPMGRCWDSSVA